MFINRLSGDMNIGGYSEWRENLEFKAFFYLLEFTLQQTIASKAVVKSLMGRLQNCKQHYLEGDRAFTLQVAGFYKQIWAIIANLEKEHHRVPLGYSITFFNSLMDQIHR